PHGDLLVAGPGGIGDDLPAVGLGIAVALAYRVVVVTIDHAHLGTELDNGVDAWLRRVFVDVDDTGEVELARGPGQSLPVVAVRRAGEGYVAELPANLC